MFGHSSSNMSVLQPNTRCTQKSSYFAPGLLREGVTEDTCKQAQHVQAPGAQDLACLGHTLNLNCAVPSLVCNRPTE